MVSEQKQRIGHIEAHHLFQFYSVCCLQWCYTLSLKLFCCGEIVLTVTTVTIFLLAVAGIISNHNKIIIVYTTLIKEIIFVCFLWCTWSWSIPLPLVACFFPPCHLTSTQSLAWLLNVNSGPICYLASLSTYYACMSLSSLTCPSILQCSIIDHQFCLCSSSSYLLW